MKLVGLCGSLRKGSFNRKLMHQAADLAAPSEFIDANLRLPLYDGDLEADSGIPADVQLLADQIAASDAVLIASPEYNQSLSGVLKNALDWVSRVEGNPWAAKPVALLHATAGRAGGARANYALRLCMAPFQAKIVPGPEMLLAGAQGEFDDAGNLSNARYTESLTTIVQNLKAMV